MVKLSSKGTEKRIEIDKEWLKKSFGEGHYVESIILLHYLLEVRMNSIFDIACTMINNPGATINRLTKKRGKNLYLISEYRYIIITEVLYDLCLIDTTTYKELKKFNTARNDSVHRLFKNIPTKAKLRKDFELGMELLEKIHAIHHELFDKRMKQTREMLKTLREQVNDNKD